MTKRPTRNYESISHSGQDKKTHTELSKIEMDFLKRRVSIKKIKEDKTKRPTRNNMDFEAWDAHTTAMHNNHGVGCKRMPDEMSMLIHDFIRPDFIKINAEKEKQKAMAELMRMVNSIHEMIDEMDYTVESDGGWGGSIVYGLVFHGGF